MILDTGATNTTIDSNALYFSGHDGNVSFLSKTQLIEHYEKSHGAIHFGGRLMIMETKAALKLINKYFKD